MVHWGLAYGVGVQDIMFSLLAPIHGCVWWVSFCYFSLVVDYVIGLLVDVIDLSLCFHLTYSLWCTLGWSLLTRNVVGLRGLFEIYFNCRSRSPPLSDGTPGQEVSGYAYLVQSEDEAQKVAYYETKAYKATACWLFFTDQEDPAEAPGQTFMYAGDACTQAMR